MKILFLISLVSAFTSSELSAVDEVSRTFTDIDGRKTQATLLRADNTNVVIKTADGVEHVVPYARLSDADKKHAVNWLLAHPQQLLKEVAGLTGAVPEKYRFSVSWTKEKIPGSEHRLTGVPEGYDGKADNWQCKLKLTNTSSGPVENVLVVYQVEINRDRNTGDATARAFGSVEIDSLKVGASKEIITKPVELAKITLRKGFISKSTNTRTAPMTDTIKGVAVKVIDLGLEAFQWASPGVPNKIETPASRSEPK